MSFSQSNLNESFRFIPRYRFGAEFGNDITLKNIRGLLQNKADENGIPVAFRKDVLTTGSLFNRQKEDVLVLYNPEHENDYLNFLIRITHQGKYAFLDIFKVGGSKNYSKSNKAGNTMAVGLLNLATGLKSKLEIEENYYTILSDCMREVFD